MRNVNQSLIDKLKQNIQTDHTMSIQVSRAKSAVIDSSYWTVETIREKSGLGDISIAPRRLESSGRPDRLYEIHVDNGVVSTALREYPDRNKDGWQEQFTLGGGHSVAIAFDGEWDYYRKKWRPRTIGEPWIFWADSSNILYSQHWDDDSTKHELSSSVWKVKAIRAWKNRNINVNDQGIVVLYIKYDRKVYYRSYAIQDDGEAIWENERQITDFTGQADNVNLFITNDYRLGILIEDTSHNIHMLITGRNWAGMALGREKVTVGIDANVELIKINEYLAYETEKVTAALSADIDYLYAGAGNEILSIANVDNGSTDFGRKIVFTTQERLLDLGKEDFILKDAADIEFVVMAISEVNDEYIVETSNFNNASGDLTLVAKVDSLNNEAGTRFDSFEKSFTPTGLIPTGVGPPASEVIWNE